MEKKITKKELSTQLKRTVESFDKSIGRIDNFLKMTSVGERHE